ncbi:uncharacterized protein LOC110274813 [Arachis duranensis]|uniref:Uncharacterized protein LOC110274813 n=1 Tax=Arachis duranensis TaxID=130453 RepID=A0A6P5ML60_ARADU|nr:uncharacterized protein LOC110274813 [Arachis duranensis]
MTETVIDRISEARGVDSLVCVGVAISDANHIEAVLNGLLKEYTSFITIITARSKSVSIEKLEALLIAHEELLEKCKKPNNLVQAHLAYIQSNFYHSTGGFNGRKCVFRGRDGIIGYGNGRAEVPSHSYNLSVNLSYTNILVQNVAEFATPTTLQDPDWFPNSRVTHHMTANAHNFGKSHHRQWFRFSKRSYSKEQLIKEMMLLLPYYLQYLCQEITTTCYDMFVLGIHQFR